MPRLTAHEFPGLYDNLDVDTDKLGFIMLKVRPFPVLQFVEDGEDDLYYSPDKDSYIQGVVAETKAHVTLLGGLLKPGPQWRKEVDQVLESWVVPRIKIKAIGAFPSPYPDQDYSCIVAHIDVTPELQEGNDRLAMLPHINMFPGYHPHVTIAYVKSDATQKWIDTFQFLEGFELEPTGINYGSEK